MTDINTLPGRMSTLAGFLADAELSIKDRGGADSMYANDPGKLRQCNAWVDHAKPIIRSMMILDDEADCPLLEARVASDRARKWSDPVSWQTRDYDEARGYIKDARKALYEMLDGIRDMFIADERCGCGDTDAQTEEADDFNDWLDANTISVDDAIQAVERSIQEDKA